MSPHAYVSVYLSGVLKLHADFKPSFNKITVDFVVGNSHRLKSFYQSINQWGRITAAQILSHENIYKWSVSDFLN